MTCRIDKWLWTVRVFKSRSVAAEACKKGRVLVQGGAVKPSREVHVGDVLQVRRPPVTYTFRVTGIASSRVGAKLVSQFMENITAPDQQQLIDTLRLERNNTRAKGTGRPTKKERRSLDTFLDSDTDFAEEFDFDEEFLDEDE